MTARLWKLRPKVQHYAWGQKGPNSTVYRLARENRLQLPSDPETPFAELWYGAHPSAPASLDNTSETLNALIQREQERVLGKAAYRFGMHLPYLAKILSIRTPLSIQLHPTKEQAKQLRERSPHAYPDDNHKPELAYSLTELDLLYGFRPLAEVLNFLDTVPELRFLVGEVSAQQFTCDAEGLSALYAKVLTYPEHDVQRLAHELIERLRSNSERTPLETAILSAAEHFPSDSGLFSFYFLNVYRLDAGVVFFTPAGVPHAYIRGELFECMAASDNVIRVGLTNKFKDRDALIECADFAPSTPVIIQPRRISPFSNLYSPPVEDFEVVLHTPATEPYSVQTDSEISGPEMWIVLNGEVQLEIPSDVVKLSSGESAFIFPAGADTIVTGIGAHNLVCQVRVPT